MRISINLASRPFIEIRPLLARLRLAMGLLALLTVVLGLWLHSVSRRAAAAEARIDQLRAQTLALQQQRSANESRMRQPANQAVLDRSHFLNAVFASKSFSWTAVMMDLERVLPAGVQVTSIEPQISKEGDVTIRLRVAGDRDRAVQLVRNLEHSSRFLQPRLATEATQAPSESQARQAALQPAGQPTAPLGVEFDILSGYNPLPPTTAPGASASRPGSGAATRSRSRSEAAASSSSAAPSSAAPSRPVVTSAPPTPAERGTVVPNTRRSR